MTSLSVNRMTRLVFMPYKPVLMNSSLPAWKQRSAMSSSRLMNVFPSQVMSYSLLSFIALAATAFMRKSFDSVNWPVSLRFAIS